MEEEFSIKNKLKILTIILFILISISCVNATQIQENESTLYISQNTTNELSNINKNDFTNLYDEIDASSQTKILNLTKDYTYNPQNDGKYSSGITIDIDDLTIDGQGHTINANNQARIFNIKSNNVTLKNLAIINGNGNSYGGAIYWTGLNGKIEDSIFKNSTSPNSGGAIYFKNAATVTNSKFINNSAHFGGAIDFEQNSAVTNCEFTNNFATYLGGAVFSSVQTRFFNSRFIQNEAGDGGGIYFFTTGTIENSLFERNIAIGYGGAITNENTLTIKNSTFTKNTGAYAGAIFLKGDGNIDNSIFNENIAKTGGAISSYCFNTSILNSEFNLNTAEKGKSLEIENKHVKLENLTFSNEYSSYESEIYMQCANPILNNLSFKNITKKDEPSNTNESTAPTVVKKVIKKKTAIIAKTKTFKSTKTKKYAVILKSGKTILKNKKIKLNLKGKTYNAKTNKKGKAIFKLKITKKGKYKAVIRFYGDKLYKATKKIIYIIKK